MKISMEVTNDACFADTIPSPGPGVSLTGPPHTFCDPFFDPVPSSHFSSYEYTLPSPLPSPKSILSTPEFSSQVSNSSSFPSRRFLRPPRPATDFYSRPLPTLPPGKVKGKGHAIRTDLPGPFQLQTPKSIKDDSTLFPRAETPSKGHASRADRPGRLQLQTPKRTKDDSTLFPRIDIPTDEELEILEFLSIQG